MTYTISIKRPAQKSLAGIPETEQNKIIAAISQLASNPRPSGVKKLSGRDGWRIRIGDYRVIYEIHDRELIVLVVDIGHRRFIYR
jgi:mRNA interferase RelE/StbE